MSELDVGLNVLGHYDGSVTSFGLKVREIAPDAIIHNGAGPTFYKIGGISPGGDHFIITVLYDSKGAMLNVKIQGTSPTDDGKEAAKSTIDQLVESARISVSPVVSGKNNGTNGRSQQ